MVAPALGGKVLDGGLFDVGSGDVVVGIDQSYTGFAVTVLDTDNRYASWVYKGKGQGVGRLVDLQAFLLAVLQEVERAGFTVETIAMEGYAPGAKFGREIAGELGAAVKLALHVRGHEPPLVVAPTAVKKFATGKGAGIKKQQMLLQVYKKWGVEYYDDNQCDSYVLARIALGEATLAYEREVLEKLTA